MKGHRHLWTTEDVRILTEKYPHVSTSELARSMGLSKMQVYRKAKALLLKKDPAAIAATRFKPGQIPWNDGTPFASGGRSVETRFKPGNMPHTWRPIGTERVSKEGYLERKVADTRVSKRDYVPVHHLVWREAGREIPKGSVLAFRDGDKRNFAIDNLELVTRQELMRLNSVHNRGPEIAQLIQLRGAISRQINKREGKIT